MGEVLVADLETNGIDPSRIWVVGVLNVETDEYTSYVGDDIPEGLMRIAEADLVIGHYFKKYDAKVINKLTEGLITLQEDKIIDTVELSRSLFSDLPNHKLKTWGDIFEYPKIDYDKGFEEFHPEMLPYCERDVRLNKRVYDFFVEHLEQSS